MFKIGDKVVLKEHIKNNVHMGSGVLEVTSSSEYNGEFEFEVVMFKENRNDGILYGGWYKPEEIELDKEYYRNKKIGEIIDGV